MPDLPTPTPADGAPAAPPMAPPGPPGGMAPPGGPTGPATMGPQSNGLRARGMILMSLGLQTMEKAVSMLGVQTDEGRAALKALNALSKVFGKAPKDMGAAEVKMLGEQVGGAPTPQNPQAFAQAMKSKLGGM